MVGRNGRLWKQINLIFWIKLSENMEPSAPSTFAVDRLAIFLLLMTVTIRGMVQENNAFLGSNAVLECVGNSTGSGVNVVWTLPNGTHFRHNSLSTKRNLTAFEFCLKERFCSIITEDENGALLRINEVKFEDVGDYRCFKSFTIAGLSETIQFSLQVQDYPRLRVQDNNSTKEVLSADCCVNVLLNMDDYFIEWLLDGDPNFPITFQKEKETSSGRTKTICSFIKFRRKRQYHLKTLECLLTKEHSVMSSASIQLDVWYAARFTAGKFSNSSTPFLVDINAKFNITCLADGNPQPFVQLEMLTSENQWIKSEDSSQLIEEGNNSWTFLHRGIKEDTIFRCIADNLFHQNAVSDNILIEVMYLDSVKMLNKTLMIERDSEFNISCQTNGNPRPIVHLLRESGSSGWDKVNVTPIFVAQDKHITTVNFLLTTDESTVDGSSFKCKAFESSTNKSVTSSEFQLEIKPTLLELVKTNLNSIVIVGVGLVVIITIIATGVSRRRKSLYNLYSTIRPGYVGGASYSRTDVSTTLSPPPISGSIPDLCRLGSSDSSAYDLPNSPQKDDNSDDYDEVESENLTLKRADPPEERPRRDDAHYSLTYNRGGDSEQAHHHDVQDPMDDRKLGTTFVNDTYSGYDM